MDMPRAFLIQCGMKMIVFCVSLMSLLMAMDDDRCTVEEWEKRFNFLGMRSTPFRELEVEEFAPGDLGAHVCFHAYKQSFEGACLINAMWLRTSGIPESREIFSRSVVYEPAFNEPTSCVEWFVWKSRGGPALAEAVKYKCIRTLEWSDVCAWLKLDSRPLKAVEEMRATKELKDMECGAQIMFKKQSDLGKRPTFLACAVDSRQELFRSTLMSEKLYFQ